MNDARDEGMRPCVLVTGSGGLIGSEVCRALRQDYDVVGLDSDPRPEGRPERWLQCDLTDDDAVHDALARLREERGPKLASVVHLAAYYDFSGEPSPLYQELTVEGTRRLLRGLSDFDAEQFVFSSSLLVMKARELGQVIDEVSPIDARWDYPQSKLEAENVIREERGDTRSVVLRIAGVYDDDCHSIPLAQQMRRIFEKQLESYFFPGNAQHGQSFLHLDDLVACFRAVVERRTQLSGEEVFLAGEEDLVSYEEIQSILGQALHGVEWPTARMPAPVAKAGAWIKNKTPGTESFIKPWMIDLADAHRPISIERARRALGWEPRRSLRETLPTMAGRLLDDPSGWYEENGLEPPDDIDALARPTQDPSEAGSRRV